MSNILTAAQLAQKLRELQRTSLKDFMELVHKTKNSLHNKEDMKVILQSVGTMALRNVGGVAGLALGAFGTLLVSGVKGIRKIDQQRRAMAIKKIQTDIGAKHSLEKLSPAGSGLVGRVWGDMKSKALDGQVLGFGPGRFAELATKVSQINQYTQRQMEESLGYAKDRIADGHRKAVGKSLVGVAAMAGAAVGAGVAMSGVAAWAPIALVGYGAYRAIQSMRDHSKQALMDLAKETSKAYPDQKLDEAGSGLVSKALSGFKSAPNRETDARDEVESVAVRESARPR